MRNPRQTFRIAALLGALALGVVATQTAGATIVERVVAVVGERPILLSELRKRAKPFLSTLTGPASARAQAQSQLYSEMLERMIDEELVRRAASRAQLSVSKAEVDGAIERVAKGNGVDADTLIQEVERSGVNVSDYRRELRSQLLDAKVMQLRLQGRVRVSMDELRATYDQLVLEEQKQVPVRIAVIRIAPEADVAAARRLATDLARQARGGADFAELSRRYSTDSGTREAGGLLAPVPPAELPSTIRQALGQMSRGMVSAPLNVDGTVVVVKLLERPPSSLPPFEDITAQLEQRVQLQKMEKARRAWLDTLRETTHVEVRL